MEPLMRCLAATQAWVETFVVKHGICPFAAREVAAQRIRYRAVSANDWSETLLALLEECRRLDEDSEVETTLLVLSEGSDDFDDYLDLLGVAEDLLADQGYDGIYQLASFHPDYRFEGGAEDDESHYTNRSPWPMLHLLREASLTRVLEHYPDPESIPERNIALMHELGRETLERRLATLKMLG
ncbi:MULTISPECIES: DUF1415 domain-containing protein [Halomonadaceae]|uniref:DUF1415 domain-containing protein n=1 Tax=Halomonadaceae TaxID=28256 RepID=UPI00159993A6|nr:MULTISPECIES: DUF1415 domain-containing protein [Halomonas]QJQ96214.1 DUF1415 domain-containing protein [Halomonas sp. PA5]